MPPTDWRGHAAASTRPFRVRGLWLHREGWNSEVTRIVDAINGDDAMALVSGEILDAGDDCVLRAEALT